MSARTEKFIDDVIASSFKDYHVKGFDYLCVRRSPRFTEKIYLFHDHITELPEVVHPHDHRYDFDTDVLAGKMMNTVFVEHERGEPYECFDYLTPLNGGNGFTWRREARLWRAFEDIFWRGTSYESRAAGLHTIRILEPGTVLRLTQYEDVVPIGQPTRTFTHSKEPIPLSGLYSRFTADEVVERLTTLGRLLAFDFFRDLEKDPVMNLPACRDP